MSVEPRRAAHVIAAAHSPPNELPRVAVAAQRAQNRRAGGLLQAEAAPSSAPHVTKGRLTFGEDSRDRSRAQKKGTPYDHTSDIGFSFNFYCCGKKTCANAA